MSSSVDPQEVGDLLRSVSFALEHGRASMVAFVDHRHVRAISRDVDRMGEMIRQVKVMLDRLPPAVPMSPEREKAVGGMIAAALSKRFGEGSADDVQQAVDTYLALDGPTTP